MFTLTIIAGAVARGGGTEQKALLGAQRLMPLTTWLATRTGLGLRAASTRKTQRHGCCKTHLGIASFTKHYHIAWEQVSGVAYEENTAPKLQLANFVGPMKS